MEPNLISVIIPCFNHGHYLPVAIDSVLQQSHTHMEIIVVDDGSSDATAQIAQAYPQVKYVYQHNQGLSAARNTGIRHATGQYLVFLDADDWLYPTALETNLRYLIHNPQVAFVSGAYDKQYTDEKNFHKLTTAFNETNNLLNKNYITSTSIVQDVSSNFFLHLLQRGNFISVPASVMYKAWVFEEFCFDERLKACEDYDVYLKISRKYPALHHTGKIAAYRMHSSNMSSNSLMMLSSALEVLNSQQNVLRTGKERKAFLKGKKFWTNYYCHEIFRKLISNKVENTKAQFYTLLKFQPKYFIKYILFRLLRYK